MGDAVTLVSSAEECGKDVYKMLTSTGLMRESGDPTYTFATTGAPEEFETIGRRFLGAEMMAASQFAGGLAVRLTVIGCSGSYPGPDSPASCYLLEQEHEGRTWRVLMDLGNGALGALQRYVDPLGIDAVLLSHLHADHCLDLCGYYVHAQVPPRRPAAAARRSGGPSDTAGRMARAYDLARGPGHDGRVRLPDLGAGRRGERRPVHASRPCRSSTRSRPTGCRVARGRRARRLLRRHRHPARSWWTVATGADLLLAEASFHHGADNPPGIHLTGTDCGDVARDAGVGRLVITHVPPWYDPSDMLAAAQEVWDGPSELARAGATYDV